MEITELFAVEADELLRTDFVEEALKLCLDGMEHFPDYPVAFGVLADIYERKGSYEDALSVLEDAFIKFPFNKSLLFKKKEFLIKYQTLSQGDISVEPVVKIDEKDELIIESQIQKHNDVSFLKLVQSFEGDEKDTLELMSSNLKLIPGIEFTPLHVKTKKSESYTHIKPINGLPPYSFEPSITLDESSDVASHKKTAKTKHDENIKTKPEPEFTIVTETIAKILEQQGALDAAIKAYSELSKENPEKQEYFDQRISEIKNKKKN